MKNIKLSKEDQITTAAKIMDVVVFLILTILVWTFDSVASKNIDFFVEMELVYVTYFAAIYTYFKIRNKRK